ncbi:ribonuclease E/G [Streptomyces sp. NPDC059193]|uniref:Rne/Rng family ribonuclease n=1 Tax=Streptomyces sp. NPDC059193 TaxID=3346763 RepID=UPI0036954360
MPNNENDTTDNTSPSDNLPPRRRRRAASRPAGPPGATAAETTPVTEAAPAAPVEEAAPAAAPARTRRRATRAVAAPETPAAEAAVVEAPAAPAVAEEEPAAPAPRARRRATRAVTAPAAPAEAPVADEAPAAVEEAPKAAARAVTVADAVDSPTRRSRRRATRSAAPAAPAAAPQPAAEPEAPAAPARARRAARPAVAVFQAPVFAEPMFQTPETAAMAAAAAAAAVQAEEAEEEAETELEAEVEAEVVETPAPQPSGRRRRRGRGAAAESAPVSLPEVLAEEEPEAEAAELEDESADFEEGDESGERPSRRRRRGGRRRRRGEAAELDEAAEEETGAPAAEQETDEDEGEEDEGEETEALGSSSSRRRRRRRRRSGEPADVTAEGGEEDGVRTVVKVREPRPARERAESTSSDEVQSIKGSTRLEAKKQRRREGREQGRRRVPIITEAEFLARREAVERVMVVRQNGDRTQIGVLEDNVLVEHYVNKEEATSYVGNVYLGKVQNVLPSMEAAFIDIGKGRNAVLYAGEVNFEALGMANGPRRIESALKSGQSVLVQVTKDPIGHKGARLTSQVSLPGRYLVYVPEGSMTGISRKLPDTERARLKTILKKIVPEDAGVIVRTAAEGASEDELRRDVERLQAQWEDIQKKSKQISTSSPSLLYGEPDMTVRVVRDIFNEDFSKVIVSGDGAWETIHGYVNHVAPDLADRLSRWTSEVDVFATYRIDEQLAKALDRKVWLPSGGSLVIDKTEAMIVIDVNTGKFTGQGGNLEETVTRNNLEAAEEIVRQLRLRDLGGIVVIDFIDMVLESNRDLVLRRMLECLGRDRTKHQVAEVTSLGLVQMTRKRVGQGLLESFSETCVHCNGRGVIVHMETPTAIGGGNGKRSKRRGGKADFDQHDHEVETVEVEFETAEELAAEVAAPRALPEPEFVADEELYSSPAEAEAAAGLSGRRNRRRATRKATAPAGAPRGAAAPAPARAEAPVAAPVVEDEPVTEPADTVLEPAAEVVAEAVEPAETVEAAPVEEAAPKGRTRRRATRKATAPAGAPAPAAEAAPEPVVVAEPEPVVEPEPEPVAVAAEPEPEAVAEAPVAEAAPARPRRRATRKATAPAGSPAGAAEAAVLVVEAPAAEEKADKAEKAEKADKADKAEDAEEKAEAAPAKKAARKAPAKKATAAKKTTTAKKATAAKKTVAKKAATTKKTATKRATKKTAAAEQQTLPSVSAPAEA